MVPKPKQALADQVAVAATPMAAALSLARLELLVKVLGVETALVAPALGGVAAVARVVLALMEQQLLGG